MRRNATASRNLPAVARPRAADEPSPAQLRAIEALALGATFAAAAEAAGVDRTTVYRWRRDDAAFVAGLNRALRDRADAMRAELEGLAAEAVETIRQLMRSGSEGVRLRAAHAALSLSGGLEVPSHGPTEAEAIREKWERQAHDPHGWEELFASLGGRPPEPDPARQ